MISWETGDSSSVNPEEMLTKVSVSLVNIFYEYTLFDQIFICVWWFMAETFIYQNMWTL